MRAEAAAKTAIAEAEGKAQSVIRNVEHEALRREEELQKQVQTLKQQLSEVQIYRMDELQGLRDEYETILEGERAAATVKLVTTSMAKAPGGESQGERADYATTAISTEEPRRAVGGLRKTPIHLTSGK